MSRTTQYIGLNKFARDLVSEATSVVAYSMTTGMFDEDVEGNIYHLPPDNHGNVIMYKEVVQVVPWSSGPMIFTNLQEVMVKESGQTIVSEDICSWILDPSLGKNHIEVDYETARYYV